MTSMEDKQKRFEEQEAPLKNTDHAYVQVSEDGSPRMPQQESGSEEQEEKRHESDRQHEPGTTKHR